MVRMRRTVRYVRPLVAALAIAVPAGAVLVGCGDDAGDSASGAADGASLYQRHCASCHGADLRGTSIGPSQLSIVYEPSHHPDEAYRAAIRNGVQAHHFDVGPMPAVPGLDDAEIDAIIAHIREVQEREGFEPYPPD